MFFVSLIFSLLVFKAQGNLEISSEVTVECTFRVSTMTNIYTCYLGRVELTSPNLTLIVSGQHLPNHSDADVLAVDSEIMTRIWYFNGEIMRTFRNLQSLTLSFVGLRQFHFAAFDECSSLQSLSIVRADITTMPSGLLSNCRNLRRFQVTNTQLTSLPGNLFGTITSLETFLVTSNPITTLPPNLFQHALNLKRVSLWSTRISEITQSLFMGVNNLESIDLSWTPITRQSIVENSLSTQTGLHEIRLWQVNMDNFDFGMLRRFVGLETFEFAFASAARELRNIDWMALPASLRELNVIRIGEPILENAFTRMTNLTRLCLSGVAIKSFGPNTFSSLVNLRELYLVECGLTWLHPELFSTLSNLQLLSLTGNEIEELPPGVFANLTNLGNNMPPWSTSLVLWFNRIRRLNANAFGVHEHLGQITVSHNGLYEIEREIFGQCFPNLHHFLSVDNKCFNGMVSQDFDSSPELEYCFANWLGVTTTTTESGAGKIESEMSVLAVALFVGVFLLMK